MLKTGKDLPWVFEHLKSGKRISTSFQFEYPNLIDPTMNNNRHSPMPMEAYSPELRKDANVKNPRASPPLNQNPKISPYRNSGSRNEKNRLSYVPPNNYKSEVENATDDI